MHHPNGPFRVVFTRANTGAGRAFRFASEQPSWLVRAAAWAVLFAFGALALLLIVPLLILAVAAFLVLAAVGWVRSRFAPARPGTPDEGRRNVRVITRGEP